MYKAAAFIVMLGLGAVVLAGGDRPALRGGPAKFTPDQLEEIKKGLAFLPMKDFLLIIEVDGKKTTLGKAPLGKLKTVAIYSPDFKRSKVADEIVTTVGDYIRVVWTSDIPDDLKVRVDRVEQLLKAGLTK